MQSKIANVCLIASAVLVLGAAGDSDLGRLTIESVILRLIVGAAVFGIGMLLRTCTFAKTKRGVNNGR